MDHRQSYALLEEAFFGDALLHQLDQSYELLGQALKSLAEGCLPQTPVSHRLCLGRNQYWHEYDSTWTLETGVELSEWREYFVWAMLMPALLPSLGLVLVRVYAGRGLVSSWYETNDDRHMADYAAHLSNVTRIAMNHTKDVLQGRGLDRSVAAILVIETWADSMNWFV